MVAGHLTKNRLVPLNVTVDVKRPVDVSYDESVLRIMVGVNKLVSVDNLGVV